MPQNFFLDAFLKGLDARDENIRQQRALEQGMTLAQMQNAIQQRQIAISEGQLTETKAENLRVNSRVEAAQAASRHQNDILEESRRRDDLFNILKESAAGRITTQPSQEAVAIEQSAVGPLGGIDIAGQRVIPVPIEEQAKKQASLQNLIAGEKARGEIEARRKFLSDTPELTKHLSALDQAGFILDRNIAHSSTWPSFFIDKVKNGEMALPDAIKSYNQLEQFRARELTPFQQIDVAGKRLAGQVVEKAKQIVESESQKSEVQWGDAERARLPVIARALATQAGADPAAVIEALKDLDVLNPPRTSTNKLKELQQMSEEMKKKREEEQKKKPQQILKPTPTSSKLSALIKGLTSNPLEPILRKYFNWAFTDRDIN